MLTKLNAILPCELLTCYFFLGELYFLCPGKVPFTYIILQQLLITSHLTQCICLAMNYVVTLLVLRELHLRCNTQSNHLHFPCAPGSKEKKDKDVKSLSLTSQFNSDHINPEEESTYFYSYIINTFLLFLSEMKSFVLGPQVSSSHTSILRTRKMSSSSGHCNRPGEIFH